MSKIQSVFNEKIPFPKLLADFEQWAEKFEYGELGYFEFSADKLNDYWIEDGSQLANQFALWLHLPDGSMIGFWRPSNFTNTDTLPIVLLGSEREQRVLADSLEEFLYIWAEGIDYENSVYELLPDETDEDTEFKHAEMLDWLTQNNIQEPNVQKTVNSEDLQQFFNNWQAQHAPKKQRKLP